MLHNTTVVHPSAPSSAEIFPVASADASIAKKDNAQADTLYAQTIVLPGDGIDQESSRAVIKAATGIAILAVHEDYAASLASAAELYISRRDGLSDPSGHFTSGPKWHPDEDERCWCCSCIREPSWRWPLSLEKHCRSIEHVAALTDVDATDLRRAVRGLKAKREGV